MREQEDTVISSDSEVVDPSHLIMRQHSTSLIRCSTLRHPCVQSNTPLIRGERGQMIASPVPDDDDVAVWEERSLPNSDGEERPWPPVSLYSAHTRSK